MNRKTVLLTGISLIFALVFIMAPVSASSDISSIKLTDYHYPSILGPNEEGILTVNLTNTGKNTVVLNDIYLKYYGTDEGILETNTDWRNLPLRILAGESLIVPMPIKAGNKTGTYYAALCIDSNYGYVYDSKQPIVIKIAENTPELAISNIKITNTGDYYTLNADVNNLGFDTAYSLTLTSLEGGDVGPYSFYPVGNLDADDVAGFTITFAKPENNKLTVVTDYKNADREHVVDQFEINLSNHLTTKTTDGSIVPIVLLVVVVAVVLLIVVCVVRKHKKGKKN